MNKFDIQHKDAVDDVKIAPVRICQRWSVAIASLVFGPIFMVGPAAGGIAMAWLCAPRIGLPAGALSVGLSLFIAGHMFQNFQWVELDGPFIRGRKFWSRQIVQQRIDDITVVLPLVALAKHDVTNLLIDRVMGTSNRGYEIRFRHGPKIALVRGDMIDVDGFLLKLRDAWEEQRT